MKKLFSVFKWLNQPRETLTPVLFAALATAFFVSPSAQADSVTLMRNVVRQPPADLVDSSGKFLDIGQASTMAQAGTDLSTYDPAPSRIWQNKTYKAASDSKEYYYPAANAKLRFLAHDAKAMTRFMYTALVQDAAKPTESLRLTISRNAHAMLFTAALLRKLGYFVPSPKLYRNITLQFQTEGEVPAFISAVNSGVITDSEKRNWLKINPDKKSVTLRYALVEPSLAEYFALHQGALPNPKKSAQGVADLIKELSTQRAFRAAILPLTLMDIPESINRFSPKLGSVFTDNVILTHPSAYAFGECSYEDARWVARKILNLSLADWKEIIAAADFPEEEYGDLVFRKLMYRVHNAAELFQLPKPSLPLPELKYTSPKQLVVDGIATKEELEDSPIRWAHGDRESPFEDGDLYRYLRIRGITTAVQILLAKVNEKMQFLTMEQAADEFQEKLRQQITEHIRTKPKEILYRKVQSWGGPIANASINANRQVTTGTYYGSTAPVQLVDTLTASATIGYFRALDGIQNFLPLAGGNLSYVRDYTHVRPVLSVRAATQESWKKLLVSNFMKNLAGILAEDEAVAMAKKPEATKEGEEPKPNHPLDKFLAELGEGEVFTITDSIALTAYLAGSSPLDALLGLNPFNFINTISFGADASRIVLKQTMFIKTSEGVQVLLRGGRDRFGRGSRTNVYGGTFDVNFFLHLLRTRASKTDTIMNTDAYVIDYSTELASKSDAKSPQGAEVLKDRKKLQESLYALFAHNSADMLKVNFPHKKFELRHKIDTRELNTRLFTQRMINFSEGHELKIRPPDPEKKEAKAEDQDPNRLNDPNVFIPEEEYTLYSFKMGALTGRDFISAIMDVLEGIFKKTDYLPRSDNPNPAAVPFGQASWRIVNTESDLSEIDKPYPSSSIVQHIWGGWHLSAQKFMSLLDQAAAVFKDADLDSTRIIEKERFATAKQIDFYRISSNISIFSGGLERIKDLLLQRNTKEKPAYNPPRGPLRFLTQIGGRYEPKDALFHENLMSLYGNGDTTAGKAAYSQQCRDKVMRNNGEDRQTSTGYWLYGTYYECLTPAMKVLVQLRRSYPENDKKAQTRWLTNAVNVLEQEVPLPALMKFLGKENYVHFVQVNGFRSGDEDGDLEFFSNTSGDPDKDFDTANGVFNLYSVKTRIIPAEMQRTNASFQ